MAEAAVARTPGGVCRWRAPHVIIPAVTPNIAPNAPVDECSLATSEASRAPNGSDKPLSVPSASALRRECVAW